jgi:hypothetical protein
MPIALRLVLVLSLGVRSIGADAAPDAAPAPAPDPATAATPAHGKITGHLTTIVTPGSGGPSITVTPNPPAKPKPKDAKPKDPNAKDPNAKDAKADGAKADPAKPIDLHVGDGVAITIDGVKATFDDLRIDDPAVVEFDASEASRITVTRAPPSKKAKPANPPQKKQP